MCMLNHFGNVIKYNYVHAKLLQSCRLFATLWAIAHQAPLSMGFSRQAYGSGLPCPPPGDLPNPRVEPHVSQQQAGSLPLVLPGKPYNIISTCIKYNIIHIFIIIRGAWYVVASGVNFFTFYLEHLQFLKHFYIQHGIL